MSHSEQNHSYFWCNYKSTKIADLSLEIAGLGFYVIIVS